MNIHKGDTVKILAGKDRGKEGKVIKVNPEENRILVEGVNLTKRHRKSKKQGEKGEVVSLPCPLNVSNAMIVCGSCSKPARVGHKIEDGKKTRYCKKCKSAI